jgi:hypothetical protein
MAIGLRLAGFSGIVSLCAILCAGSQVRAQQSGVRMSEDTYKDVKVLKGIPADEFLDTMGMFSAALQFDCTGCHAPGVSYDRESFSIPTPKIQMARVMILMMNEINAKFFGGKKRVTCFTCHAGDGTRRPRAIPDLAIQYGEPREDPNAADIYPDQSAPPANEVFAKYFNALGGLERVSKVTTLLARGRYTAFDTPPSGAAVEIYARAPNQRTVIVRSIYGDRPGDSVRVFDGRTAWKAGPDAVPSPMVYTGGNLLGARIDAVAAFPAEIPKAFKTWVVGSTEIDGSPVQILQGSDEPDTPLANFYFDESGLLVRLVRWNPTPVGSIPTQIDFSDYREVTGVKMPFRMLVTWTNGQADIVLSEIRPNVAIDASRFGQGAGAQ